MTEFRDTGVGEAGDRPVRLSLSGEARREEMLSRLQAALGQKRRIRSASRWAAGAGVPLILFSLILLVRDGHRGPGSAPGPGGPAVASPSASPRDSGGQAPDIGRDRLKGIEVIHDDPEVLGRCSQPAAPLDRGILIDDQELLDLLQAAGRPAGLARVAGNVFLTDLAPPPSADPAQDVDRG